MTARTIGMLESLEDQIRQQSLGIYRAEVVKLLEKIDLQDVALAQANENTRKAQEESENLKRQVETLRGAKEELERSLKEKDEELASMHKLVEKQELKISEQRRQVERLELRASWQMVCTKPPTTGANSVISNNARTPSHSSSSESESEEKPVRLAKKKSTRSHVLDTTEASGTTGDTTDDCLEDLEALEDVASHTDSMNNANDLSVALDEGDEESEVVEEDGQSGEEIVKNYVEEISVEDDMEISALSLDEAQAEDDAENSANVSQHETEDRDVSLDDLVEEESLESLNQTHAHDVTTGSLDITHCSLDESQAESEALDITCDDDEDEAELSLNETCAGDKTDESLNVTCAGDGSLNETQGGSEAQEVLDLTPAEDDEEEEELDNSEEETEAIEDENEVGPSGNVAVAEKFHDAECTIEISDESEEDETSEDDDDDDESAKDDEEDSEEEEEYSEEDESD